MSVLSGDVMVTGASSGIGREMAVQLSRTARSLILVARREGRLKALADRCRVINPQLRVHVLPCDLSSPLAVAELLQQVNDSNIAVTALINNAGLGHLGIFESASSDHVEKILMVNVVGLTLLTRGLMPQILSAENGGILNVSSGYGLTWFPFASVYVGSKHFVSGFTVSLRAELSGTGVIVSQLCPGPVATEFLEVAGNPFGMTVPSMFEVTSESCAITGLRGFARGREIIIPGFMMWLSINVGRLTPRFVLRLFYGLMARKMRPHLKQKDSGSAIV